MRSLKKGPSPVTQESGDNGVEGGGERGQSWEGGSRGGRRRRGASGTGVRVMAVRHCRGASPRARGAISGL